MSDLSDLSDLSDICAAKISRAGKNKRTVNTKTAKKARRTAIPARYDSFSAARASIPDRLCTNAVYPLWYDSRLGAAV